MTARRRSSSATVGAGSAVDCAIPAHEVGDLLFAFVGGGNQVTSYSGSWVSIQHTTGVEAQGELLTRVADGTSADELHLTFDGGDPYRVVVGAYYSSRGANLSYQVVSSTRQGTTSGTLPAVSFTIPTAANPGNVQDTYIFTRNGATVPVVSPGSELHSYTGGHAYGFWEDIRPQDTTEIAVDLPVRTGHFRATVRFFEWEWTPWRDDSVPLSTGTVAYANPSTTSGGLAVVGGGEHIGRVEGIDAASQNAAVTAAWADATEEADFVPATRFLSEVRLSAGEYQSRSVYDVHWLTPPRTTPSGTSSGNLPPSVYSGGYVDPLVFDVEWEPTSTPVSSQLTVNVKTVGGYAADLAQHAGRPLHVKVMASGFTGIYDPDTMSANVLAALPDWDTIDVPADWVDGDTVSVSGRNDDISTDPAVPFAVAIVDDYTQTGTLPPTYSGPPPLAGAPETGFTIQWAFETFIEALFAPRYRLKRELGDTISVIRQWPRDDSLGRTATPRRWPPQRGTRRIGGQP